MPLTSSLSFYFLLRGLFKVALGQIMARSRLDWKGQPGNDFITKTTCTSVTIVLFCVITINALLLYLMYRDWREMYGLRLQDAIPLLIVDTMFVVYFYYAVCSARRSIRAKYVIPEKRCRHFEDCFVAVFCTQCAISQLGRHTADYETFRAVCFNETGIPHHVVVPDEPFAAENIINSAQMSPTARAMFV